MTEGDDLLNKHQRKKIRRKAKKQRERQAHRNLDEVTSDAIEQALELAPQVAASHSRMASETLQVELASVSEAQFVRKRVNDALNVGEWLSDVKVTLVESYGHDGSDHQKVELRIEAASRD